MANTVDRRNLGSDELVLHRSELESDTTATVEKIVLVLSLCLKFPFQHDNWIVLRFSMIRWMPAISNAVYLKYCKAFGIHSCILPPCSTCNWDSDVRYCGRTAKRLVVRYCGRTAKRLVDGLVPRRVVQVKQAWLSFRKSPDLRLKFPLEPCTAC